MEIFILDEKFRSLYDLDIFESLIWTERYNGYGDFEFYTPVNNKILQIVNVIQEKMRINLDCYVWLRDSSTAMVIENLEITTDAESGNHLIVSGRGLESLLERRIIWDQTILNGNLQEGVQKLINEAIINPKIAERRIPSFSFMMSDNEHIKSLTLKSQYTGDNLYETILEICDAYQLGFDVILDSNNILVFSLKRGTDRSYGQEENPYVVFSPNYENILNSDYLESSKTLKNVTLVAGEDSGELRKKRVVGSASGLSRKELFTDARDIQSEKYENQLNDDTESLNEFKQSRLDYQNALKEAYDNFSIETTNYIRLKGSYEWLKEDYENRITNFELRIGYYIEEINAYRNGLDDAQSEAFDQYMSLTDQIEHYDDLIEACDKKINDYNDKLQNERILSYDDIVEYEQGIESQEAIKKGYEEQKKPIEQSKTEIEKMLPDFDNTLKKYDEMKLKYEGIISNDEQTLKDEADNFSKETAEYEKKKSEYEELRTDYENELLVLNQKITEYEGKVAEDQKEIDDWYNASLDQRGLEKLSENAYTFAFTSEIEARKMFVYGKDFIKGDVVQIINEYGMDTKARVLEIVRSQDTSGYSVYPTFQVIS